MIANQGIRVLAQTLAALKKPAPEDILRAMELAYDTGKNDGAIEAYRKILGEQK